MTRVQRAFQQLPLAEDVVPLATPAFTEHLRTKLQAVEAHTKWEISISSKDIYAFSDGRSEGHGRST